MEYQNEEFNKQIAERSSQFHSLEGKNLEEYQKLKKIATQESVKQRDEINSIERSMGITIDTKKELSERILHIDAKIQGFLDDSDCISSRKMKLINEIDSVAKELQEEKLKNSSCISEKKRLRQLESELEEKLSDANNRLFQARVEKSTSDRQAKFQETLLSLKRIYPGIYYT